MLFQISLYLMTEATCYWKWVKYYDPHFVDENPRTKLGTWKVSEFIASLGFSTLNLMLCVLGFLIFGDFNNNSCVQYLGFSNVRFSALYNEFHFACWIAFVIIFSYVSINFIWIISENLASVDTNIKSFYALSEDGGEKPRVWF